MLQENEMRQILTAVNNMPKLTHGNAVFVPIESVVAVLATHSFDTDGITVSKEGQIVWRRN